MRALGSSRPGLRVSSLILTSCPSSPAVGQGHDPTWTPVNLPGDSLRARQSRDPQSRREASTVQTECTGRGGVTVAGCVGTPTPSRVRLEREGRMPPLLAGSL